MQLKTYGYARVSKTRDDGTTTLENQRLQLKACGVGRIFEDVITGVASERPGLTAMLETICKGDTVVVAAVDRLGRDTLQVLTMIVALSDAGITLKVLNLPADVQDIPGGGRLMAVLAAEFAQLERARISERTKKGLERARAQGKRLGKRWSITRPQMELIHRERRAGRKVDEIARLISVSDSVVRRALRVDPDTIQADAFKKG